MLRLHRHRHGPRIYVAGLRVHEWHLGIAVVGIVLAGHVAEIWRLTPVALLCMAGGTWLVLKDWRDILPSKRDTAAWRLGLHRPVAPLRAIRRAEGLPALAGAVAFAVGLVNLLSALTPNVAWRHHLLLQLEPVEVVPLFHTLVVPASAALIAASLYLRARRRRAWQVAVGLLLVLGVLELFKGLDFEEALISWAAAALLWWGRDSFYVRHERLHPRSPLAVVLGVVGGASALAAIGIWVATRAEPYDVVREVGSLLTWTKGPMAFGDELAWLPLAVGALGLTAIVCLTVVLFRPLGGPRSLPGPDARTDAAELVLEHGHDTLAFFKLRPRHALPLLGRRPGVRRVPGGEQGARDLGRPGGRPRAQFLG